MTRIGVTGHQNLPPDVVGFVTQGIRGVLEHHDEIDGYSSLAAGADQIFATEVLAAGGGLHVVIPAADYETTLDGEDLVRYHQLLESASETTQLHFAAPGEDAYEAAGRWIASESELLIAVWDGEPARGRGGTADTVAYARALDREVHVIWPDGVTRS
jgi:hypothetical protein